MFEFMGASAIAGALAKIADDYQDKGLSLPPILAIFISILYGVILGLLSAYTPLASLFIALAIANALTQKIDGIHIIGFCAFAAVIIYTGLSYFDPYIFSLFLICGLFDELALKRPKILTLLFENRLITPIGALLIFIYTQEPLYLAAILSFDIFYRLLQYLIQKKLKKQTKPNPR